MVFTVEPGLYIPGYGGVRVEDDIVVTKDGYRMLTDASRELVSV
jgi:Xaa-Pro aminopeptidase/Xaa-Pro dipeptidase